MMLREAQGDVASALVECEEMTRAGRRGTWGMPEKREQWCCSRNLWHRAYLRACSPSSRRGAGARRPCAMPSARKAYADAAPRPDYADAVAVLDGYFAALDGRRRKALEAGPPGERRRERRLEDLYLRWSPSTRQATARPPMPPAPGIPRQPQRLYRRAHQRAWLDRDAATRKGKAARFTPRYPRGKP
jgi:hypothetical protein